MKAMLLVMMVFAADGPVPESQWRFLTKEEAEILIAPSHRGAEFRKWAHEVDDRVCVARLSLALDADNRFVAKLSSSSKFSIPVQWGQVPINFATTANARAKRQKTSGVRTSHDLGSHALVFRP